MSKETAGGVGAAMASVSPAARVVFMGTPEFAVPSLLALAREGFDVALAVTQPDRPKGRGGRLAAPPVKAAALSLGVPVVQPVKPSEIQSAVSLLRPDFIVTAAYGCILRQPLLDIPRLGCVNVHASLLPRHRGASPVHHAILSGDAETGVTVMLMDAGVDTGDILLLEPYAIPEKASVASLGSALADIGAGSLIRALRALIGGTATRTPQDGAKATYAPQIKKLDGALDFTVMGAVEAERRVRAFADWPGAFAELFLPGAKESRRFRVLLAEAPRLAPGAALAVSPSAPAGTVASSSKSGVAVICADGRLVSIKRLQFDGGKPLDAAACWHNIPAGSRVASRASGVKG